MKHKKTIIYIIIIIIAISILSTFAWISWTSEKSVFKLTVGSIDSLSITLSPYKIDTSITPTLTYDNGKNPIYTTVEAINNKDKSADFSIYYRINTIDENLINENFKYTILKSEDGINYQEYKNGNFSQTTSNSEFIILKETINEKTTYTYKIYIWIDGSESNQSNMQGKVFNGELRANISSAENIIIDNIEGLIPVTISDNGTVTTTNKDNHNWYDYDNKKWANAILVKENTKNKYLNTKDISVSKEDILAYYVYLPRYKYKVWTLDNESTPREIEILFENKYITKSNADEIDSYQTHPAFTFGDKELNGIWIGKYEISSSEENDCYINNNTNSCNNLNIEPRILPDKTPLTNMKIDYQFQTSLKFSGGILNQDGTITFNGNSQYGLKNNINSHMLKNSEWGAILYLSHSVYGINNQITNDTLSTTGNISGIFNLSNNTPEYVMATYTIDQNKNFEILPTEQKYYDKYPSEKEKGHALNETLNWYENNSQFLDNNNQWLIRGIDSQSKLDSFAFISSTGNPSPKYSFRSVLINENTDNQ